MKSYSTSGWRPFGTRLLRGSTQIVTGGGANPETTYIGTGDNNMVCCSYSYLDTPGSGNHTYKVQGVHHLGTSGRMGINRNYSNANTCTSTLTCTEIEV